MLSSRADLQEPADRPIDVYELKLRAAKVRLESCAICSFEVNRIRLSLPEAAN